MGEASSPRPEPSEWVREVFLRLLAAVYLIAFISFWVQAEGLVGVHGILPIQDLLALARERLGPSRYWVFPTVFWLGDGDAALHVVCAAGTAFALLAALGRARPLVMLALWGLYLSLTVAGQDFLSFQWDVLLLEAGLLAVFLAPRGVLRRRPGLPPLLIVWMYRWLLFRLMFGSGLVKLTSGDPTWRGLTALQYHYETQPLPTPLAWYMHQLPAGIQKACTAFTLFIEIIVPFLFLGPKRARLAGAAITATLQGLILLTGNYTFFNWLTLALCLWLVIEPEPSKPRELPHRAVSAALAGMIAMASALLFLELFGGPMPPGGGMMLHALAPLRLVNSYGLFAVMTTTRNEILVEGSPDGENWRGYEFRYKPGDPNRMPPMVAPHQPRLDWQMWFAALSNYQTNPWFVSLTLRLLEGSPDVVALLGSNPFPNQPPRYVRAMAYEYTFTDSETHRRTGAWWKREPRGLYLPAVGLRSAGVQ